MGIHQFVKAMKEQKDHYVAKLFQDITSRYLEGLGDYMGWVGCGGYYHWKLSELGQLSACPCLQGQPVPDGPIG